MSTEKQIEYNGEDSPIEIKVYEEPIYNVASSLAGRLADMWDDGYEEKKELEDILTEIFIKNPDGCVNLWDFGVIENDYFITIDDEQLVITKEDQEKMMNENN